LISYLKHKIISFRLIIIAVFGAAYIANSKAYSQEADYKAYSLYIYNFMKYIEWPEQENDADFTIALYGKSEIKKELKNLSIQKKLKGRNIKFKILDAIDENTDCQLLYISDEKSSTIKDLVVKLRNKSVLIVGEREGLASKGASLSFATSENDLLSFDINKKALEQHKLKISSSLLKLGIVVVK
jgi:hypothetical protein